MLYRIFNDADQSCIEEMQLYLYDGGCSRTGSCLQEHATEILLMIRDVFEDIEVDYDTAAVTAQTIFSDYDLEYGGEYELSHSLGSDSEKSTDAASGLSGISLL